MTSSSLQRFEKTIRETGDVEAALDEIDSSPAETSSLSLDQINDRLHAAALQALDDERRGA